jgi:6-pyruvoyltetrahydropterin/6-carboxytetrahydropterin synthase
MDCAHFLPGHKKCGVLHGHTYKVEVIIEGENKTGMILDFDNMKLIIREVLAEYDHRSLNDFLEYPSVENICEMLQQRFREKWEFPFTIRVWEGEGKWAEL